MNPRDSSPERSSSLKELSQTPTATSERQFSVLGLAINQQINRVLMSDISHKYVNIYCTQTLQSSICIYVHLYTRLRVGTNYQVRCIVDEYDMIHWTRGTCAIELKKLKVPNLLTSKLEKETNGETTFFLSFELYERDVTNFVMERVGLLYSDDFVTVSHAGYADNHRRTGISISHQILGITQSE